MSSLSDQLVQFPKMFLSTTKPFSCNCKKHDLLTNYSVPICRRGLFLQDSFFENALALFDNAVRDVLDRWGVKNQMTAFQEDNKNHLLSNLNQYRKLRPQYRHEDQILSVASDSDMHKILLDVADFVDGVVRVRVVGERQVVVEAHKKINQHNTNGLSNTFKKEFCLPQDTSVKDIISVISSDGILIITTPRATNTLDKTKEKIIPIKIEGLASEAVSVPTSPCPSCLTSPGLTMNSHVPQTMSPVSPFAISTVHQDLNTSQKSPLQPQVKPLPSPLISLASNIPPLSSPVSSLESLVTSLASPFTPLKPHFTDFSPDVCSLLSYTSPIASPLTTLSSFSSPPMSPLTQSKHLGSPEMMNAGNTLESFVKSKMQQRGLSDKIGLSFMKLPVLPIPKLGRFFIDPFFKDSWWDFEEAVKEVVSKWGDLGSSADTLASYRTIRARDLKDENQAVKASEDHYSYKFVVDVQDFTDGGEISVKFVNPRELVVEGHVENNKTTRKFLQRFVLPGDVDVDDASSVMSADGVLTVTAPKQTSAPVVREIVLPVTVEATPEPEPHLSGKSLGLVTEREPQVTSPTLSVMSDVSSGSLGTLWTCTQPLHQGVTIEEV